MVKNPRASGPDLNRLVAGAVSWNLRPIADDLYFFEHLEEVLLGAHQAGCTLLVLPELVVLELLGCMPEVPPERCCEVLVRFAEQYEDALSKAAITLSMTIVGGSHFRSTSRGTVNTCLIASPDGTRRFQDKVKLTQFEIDPWGVAAGIGVCPPIEPGIGVTICYDSEFPECSRLLAENGMLVQCVPTYTETAHGYSRVRHSCAARAVENQIFVIQSVLTGSLGKKPVTTTFGAPGIFAPPTEPYPSTGDLGTGPFDSESLIVAELDLQMLTRSRNMGDVRNWNDRDPSVWQLKAGPAVPQ